MKRVLLACALCAASLSTFAQTAVSIVPTGADYVSGGVAMTYTPANARISFINGTRNEVGVDISGNDGKRWTYWLRAGVGEPLRPREYLFAERAPFVHGRAPGIELSGDGRGCNMIYGYFTVRQIQFDALDKLVRLEAVGVQYCETLDAPPLAIAVSYNAPNLHYAINAPDFTRNATYYGDTNTFSLIHSAPDRFQYTSSGQRDVWTMNFAVPTGQAQFAKGVYLTEGVAKPGVAGMDIGLGQNRKGEYGKLDVLTITYRNGAVVQLSARFYFYSDAARTKLVRSGRINFWK